VKIQLKVWQSNRTSSTTFEPTFPVYYLSPSGDRPEGVLHLRYSVLWFMFDKLVAKEQNLSDLPFRFKCN